MKRFVTTLTAAMLVATSAAANVPSRMCYDPHLEVLYRVGGTYTQLSSWYGPGLQGNPTASGERFDMHDPSILAHKVLPLGTVVQVENPQTGAVRIARIIDDGPHIHPRALDASAALATELGFQGAGTAELEMTIISMPDAEQARCRE